MADDDEIVPPDPGLPDDEIVPPDPGLPDETPTPTIAPVLGAETQGVTLMAAVTDVEADNVVVAITGAVYVATGTVTPPTDADTALGTGWTNVGYLSEDAVTETINSDTNDIVAWQNADVVRKVVTSFSLEYQFTMIETNAASVELYYGKAVDGTGDTHTIGGGGGGRKTFVVDAVDSAGQHVRRYIPSAEVTERGEVSLSGGDAVGYEVTLACYPSSELSGETAKVFYGTALV